MNGITVDLLYEICKAQKALGNGDKTILVSTDDEGNGYHTLFYGIDSNEETIKMCHDAGLFHDDNNVNDVVLLG